MKKIIISVAVGLCAVTAHTQESNVILDYNSISLGYFQHIDVAGDKDAHGGGLLGSLRTGNIVITGELGYSEVEDIDIDLFGVGGGVGYIYEVEERLHLVGSISLKYQDIDVDEDGWLGASYWEVEPEVAANFAISDKWGASVSIGYSDPIDSDLDIDGLWYIDIRTTFEVAENVGLTVLTEFREERGYAFLGIGLEYHF
jgi:hypothetical protein